MNFNEEEITASVIERVSDEILCSSDGIERSVKVEVNRRIDNIFAEIVESQIRSTIDDTIQEGFDRSYQAVDNFGSPTGDPTTIREKLVKITEKYWQEWVNTKGKVVARDSYGDHITRAEYVMIQICGKDFSKTLEQETVNVTAALKDGLRAELKKWTDSTLNELFRVKSSGDKK